MSGVELLPCPFCGGEASLTIPSEHVQADCADIYVSCDECEVEGQHFVVEMQDRTPDLWPYERRDAIAAWNTRTPAQGLDAATIERCAQVFRESVLAQAQRLGISPNDGEAPSHWSERVRAAAIRALNTASTTTRGEKNDG